MSKLATDQRYANKQLSALATLHAEPAFARLLLGTFISGIGDWFNTVALLGLALRLTGSPLAVGVTLALKLAFIVEGALQFAVSQALPLAVLALALATSAAGVGNACSATIIMRAAPAAAIGRVFALMGALSSVTFSLSLLAPSALLQVMPPRTLGALAGGLIASIGMATLATRSALRTSPEASVE